MLEVIKRELIRGEVIGQYTLIDDLLSTEVCLYFLPGNDLIKQWKTKKFRRFAIWAKLLIVIRKWKMPT